MNKSDLKKIICNIADELRGIVNYRDIQQAIVRILFIKYAMDNYLGANTKDDMQLYAELHKLLAAKRICDVINPLREMFKIIEREYDCRGVLDNNIFLDDYEKLVKKESNNNLSDDKDSVCKLTRVFDIVSDIDLTEKDRLHSTGGIIVDTVTELFKERTERNSDITQAATLSPILSKLVAKILDVQEDETFLDFASGMGLSTLEIIKHTQAKIINIDINRFVQEIAAMLYIMYGYRHFSIICKDSLSENIHLDKIDKIFTDFPMGIKSKIEGETVDSSESAIIAGLRFLTNVEGLAVVTAPAGVLVNERYRNSFRLEFTTLMVIKAVITLPPLKGSSINTNLVVLSRRPSDGVLFIDTVNQGSGEKTIAWIKDKEKADEVIDKIIDVINQPKTLPGFSYYATTQEVEEKDYAWLPSYYIKSIDAEETMSLDEVKSQLKQLYEELNMLK